MKVIWLVVSLLIPFFLFGQPILVVEGHAPKLKDGTAIYFNPVYPYRLTKEEENKKVNHNNKKLLLRMVCSMQILSWEMASCFILLWRMETQNYFVLAQVK
ncbi:hypothetical protein [Pedobacter gandavensis]|uniref:hypothetical protein n=1 Tax=Pedobacter gandavensis TaxID=2679963 RepID=UPI00292F40CF|nr:hypothetical protein [Pedobacter gandavensis]